MGNSAETLSDTVAPSREAGPRKRVVEYFDLCFAPALCVIALVLMAVYLNGLDLDDIEQRQINIGMIVYRVTQHIGLVAVSSAIAIGLAVSVGVLLTRRYAHAMVPLVLPIANLAQAIPTIGVLVLLAIWMGFGFESAVIALVLVSFLSVLRNTMVGIQEVDNAVIDAARGMGLSNASILFRVEIPLAIPVIIAGIRVALILNVGSAALAATINAGGLGDLITTGIALDRMPILIVGGGLTAILALAIDWIAGLCERFLRPRGLK